VPCGTTPVERAVPAVSHNPRTAQTPHIRHTSSKQVHPRTCADTRLTQVVGTQRRRDEDDSRMHYPLARSCGRDSEDGRYTHTARLLPQATP
jgi:hypothetical protein